MPLFEEWSDYADRLAQGIRRRQVAFGHDNVTTMCKRGQAGLVWATDDLSKHAFGKLAIECAKRDMPLIRAGTSEELGEITGHPGVKVYILRKSFPGIRAILRDLTPYLEPHD